MKINHLLNYTRLYYLLIVLVFFHQFKDLKAQTDNWIWAKSFGGTKSEYINSICTDKHGSVFVTGLFFSNYISFNSLNIENYDSSGNTGDIFIVKFDNNSNPIWAKGIGGSDYDDGRDIVTDNYGNVYVVGSFSSPQILFDTCVLKNNNPNYTDAFLTKYDNSGKLLWAKNVASNHNNSFSSICIDSQKNIYAAGTFSNSVIYFGSDTLFNSGSYDIYLLKFDSSGNELFAKKIGRNSCDSSPHIAVDSQDNIYLTGKYWSNYLIFAQDTLINNGSYGDILLVKYDKDGNEIWGKSVGGNLEDASNCIRIDIDNNIVITGFFNSSFINFEDISLVNNYGGYYYFIAKYDDNGNVIWANSAQGNTHCSGNSVSIDSLGNIFVVGEFSSNPITFNNNTLNSYGNTDIFIVKYNSFGIVQWAKNVGGYKAEFNNIGCLDNDNNLFIISIFNSPTIDFGSQVISNSTDYEFYDIFLAKYSNIQNVQTVFSQRELIFPNPVYHNIEIKDNNYNNLLYEIYSADGKLVDNSVIKEEKISTLNLLNGIYFLKINFSNYSICKKFVKY